MQIQNSSSPPFHSIFDFILILIFIIITSSTSFSQQVDERELFHICNSTFSCGKKFPNIGYPFWGGNKPRDCGLDGFNLTCHQDDYLTIDITGQIFQVLDISNPSYSFRIARNDLWNYVCPENYSDETIDATHFRPVGFQTLPLYYGCSHPHSGNRSFSCTNNSDNSRNELFADDEGCEPKISVLVLDSAFEEFTWNTSMTLGELLYQGFNVEYNSNGAACLVCESSGGLCFSGTNSTTSQCLCRQGPRDLSCPQGPRGLMYERRGEFHEALSAYTNALLLEPSYVPCKILVGALLCNSGLKMLPVARTLLSDALRIEPTNRLAWYHLGLVHRDDGRMADAVDCFQAASMLEESDPVESFSSIL